MQLKSSFLTLTFFCLTVKVMAFEQVHYGDGVKDVTVNSQEASLLMFPAPPIARVCHPSGVVDFFPIESGESEPHSTLSSVDWNIGNTKVMSDGTERMLKLRPYQDSQSALCDIKLSNNETVTLRFKTSASIKRPSIEFVNVFSNKSKKEKRYDGDSLHVFQNLISGGELFDFYDITTSKTDPVSKKTSKAKYEITYVGTDREKFKAWSLTVIPFNSAPAFPELKNIQINQLYFSAWKNVMSSTIRPGWKEEKPIHLFILSSNDISTDELLEKLP